MTALNKQALRKLAKALSGKEWVAFVHKASGTYAVGSLGHERGEDIIKWPGLDGQDNAESKAKFIAAANPATVLALLDALEAAENNLIDSECHVAELEESLRDKQALLEAAEKRIAELEARTVVVKQFDDFQIVHYGGSEDYAKCYIDCQNNYNKALTAAGIGVKGE